MRDWRQLGLEPTVEAGIVATKLLAGMELYVRSTSEASSTLAEVQHRAAGILRQLYSAMEIVDLRLPQ